MPLVCIDPSRGGYDLRDTGAYRARGKDSSLASYPRIATITMVWDVTVHVALTQEREARLRTMQYQRVLARDMLRGLQQFPQTTVVAMQ